MFSLSQRSAGGLDFVQVPTVKLNSTQSLESKFSTTQLLSEPEMSLDLGSQLRKLSWWWWEGSHGLCCLSLTSIKKNPASVGLKQTKSKISRKVVWSLMLRQEFRLKSTKQSHRKISESVPGTVLWQPCISNPRMAWPFQGSLWARDLHETGWQPAPKSLFG